MYTPEELAEVAQVREDSKAGRHVGGESKLKMYVSVLAAKLQHAHRDVAWLLSEVDRLREENAALTALIREYSALVKMKRISDEEWDRLGLGLGVSMGSERTVDFNERAYQDALRNERQKLVQFFRDEESEWGEKGDYENWTPERAAIELIRELRKQAVRGAAAGEPAEPPPCPHCGHAWIRHDPEDGRCDAPHLTEPGPCACGRDLIFWQTSNAALARTALRGRAPEGQRTPTGEAE